MFCEKCLNAFYFGGKDVLYNTMKSEDINWRLISFETAKTIYVQNNIAYEKEKAFVFDDTIRKRSGSKVEGTSCHFEHSECSTVRGHQMLELGLTFKNGFTTVSNYMLYNFNDTPKDLYERIKINIDLNKKWGKDENSLVRGKIFCYPMRYAPIDEKLGNEANRKRNFFKSIAYDKKIDWLNSPVWTLKFSRNIDVMKGVAHGAIPVIPSLALRTIGRTLEEYITNLYMPEEMLRNRDKYERLVYPDEKRKCIGNGEIEDFRKFILSLLKSKTNTFYFFHNAVIPNSKAIVREAINKTRNSEIIYWLNKYLISP